MTLITRPTLRTRLGTYVGSQMSCLQRKSWMKAERESLISAPLHTGGDSFQHFVFPEKVPCLRVWFMMFVRSCLPIRPHSLHSAVVHDDLVDGSVQQEAASVLCVQPGAQTGDDDVKQQRSRFRHWPGWRRRHSPGESLRQLSHPIHGVDVWTGAVAR